MYMYIELVYVPVSEAEDLRCPEEYLVRLGGDLRPFDLTHDRDGDVCPDECLVRGFSSVLLCRKGDFDRDWGCLEDAEISFTVDVFDLAGD